MSSWLGGGLSSLRGQLSHLITEDLHGDADSSDEVIMARLKITELENQLKSSSLDIKELTDKNNEFKIKLQSEEMMLQQVLDSYKDKLKEKEECIESLREKVSLDKIKRYDEKSADDGLNDFYDFVNESSIEMKVGKKFEIGDELESLRLKISKLEQEVLHWRSICDNVKGGLQDGASMEDCIGKLMETQRQDLELLHSNYDLELQQEHTKQINFLQRRLLRCERSSESDYYGHSTLSCALEEPSLSYIKEDLSSLFDTICRKIEDKEVTVEELTLRLHQSQSPSEPRETSSRLCDVACQCLVDLSLPDISAINNLQIHIPLSNCNIAESMSQVSDVSQVSITTRLLDDNVRHLSSRIAEYGHQLTIIKDVTSSEEQTNPEEVTDKLQHLKIKLSERKNTILDQHNLLRTAEAGELPIFGDSWENSSINSFAEETTVDGQQILDINMQIKDIHQTLDREGAENDLSITDTLNIVKEKVVEVLRKMEEHERVEEDIIVLHRELAEDGHGCEDIAVIVKDIKQKVMKDVCRRCISKEDIECEDVTSSYGNGIAELKEKLIELSQKNIELEGELKDVSATVTRYEDLEKVCDRYEKELIELKGSRKKSDLGMDSDDILEHVKTFNEEKDEFIEKLESRIISLQNFCEEKDDFIKALKEKKLEIIYEYDCSIGVLNCEMDNLRATVEKSYENEIDYKKQIYQINVCMKEKDEMINSLNEELTMLSHQNTEEDMMLMSSVRKVEVSAQTEEGICVNLNDESNCLESGEESVQMVEKMDMLVSENMRLGAVIEAQANSLGLYESRVKALEAEMSRLCSKSNPLVESEFPEDMTRETLHHLSQIIRDKDWEIEALKSKNESLCDIIKESSDTSETDPITTIERLVDEKEALSKEVLWYQENREQLVNALNLKHQESLNYHGEIQRLVVFINSEQSKWNQLTLENENMKEEIRILAENKMRGKQSQGYLVEAAVGFTDELPSYSECVNVESDDECKRMKERIITLEQDYQLSFSEIRKLEKQLEKVSFELEESRLQVCDLKESRNLCQTQMIHYQDEVTKLCKASVTDQTKDIWNEDKQEEITKMQQEEEVDVEEQLRLLKLQTADYAHQMDQMKARETKLLKEKQIFQDHLLRVEESYTQDATLAEDREQSLRKQLRDVEDQLAMAQDRITDLETKAAALTNNFLLETCDIRKERDDSLRKLRTTEIKLNETLGSLNNLQSVLDKMQQDQSSELRFQRERLQQDLTLMNEDRDKWRTKCQEVLVHLEAQNEVVAAAQRLTDQMEWKDDQLAKMQATMSMKEEVIDSLKMEIRKLNSVTDSKVDKVLMRNLIIGYFHTPLTKRQDALRVIGSLLQFSDKDYNQIGIDTINKSRWFSWLRSPGTDNKDADRDSQEHSFSELFIRFLERESAPLPQVRLPTNQVAAEARKHSSFSYTEDFPYVNMSSGSAISDHHKFFSPSPMITKRAATSGEESDTNGTSQREAPIYIGTLQDSQIGNLQTKLKSPSSVRRTDNNKNALLSLFDE